MAMCGTLNADGTVSVRLTWKNGSPDPSYAEAHIGVYGGQYQVITVPGPLQPGATGAINVTNLIANSTYAYTIRTYFPDGSYLDSAQISFTTPAQARIPATNLTCVSP